MSINSQPTASSSSAPQNNQPTKFPWFRKPKPSSSSAATSPTPSPMPLSNGFRNGGHTPPPNSTAATQPQSPIIQMEPINGFDTTTPPQSPSTTQQQPKPKHKMEDSEVEYDPAMMDVTNFDRLRVIVRGFGLRLVDRISKPLRVKAPGDSSGLSPIRSFVPSPISSGTPDFFEAFSDNITEKVEMEKVVNAMFHRAQKNKKGRPQFNVELSSFLLHLSALVYEAREVVGAYTYDLKDVFLLTDSHKEYYSREWGLEMEVLEIDSCAAFVFFSVEHQIAVVVFRGTSPFDISELMLDAMLQKVTPENESLPGMVHEPFYNMLMFPTGQEEDSDILETSSNNGKQMIDVGDLVRIIQEDVVARMESPPAIWFTGHSMGAALSTMVLSHLLYSKVDLETFHGPIVVREQTEASVGVSSLIKGCYTFGSPKCGDTEFSDAIAKKCTIAQVVFYRVVNADDLIPALPLGGHSIKLSNCLKKSGANVNLFKSQTDYKHLGIPVILHYDIRPTIGLDRGLESIIKNAVLYVGEIPVFVKRLLVGKTNLISWFQKGFPFPHDHLPSEYVRHMKR
ncbi:hypothetical protein HDV05_006286 [Chytridiales sp. JEL 0842]|nr:hypothetical protein HDV05_006286 [Chytridiales sp. JEL 0842]